MQLVPGFDRRFDRSAAGGNLEVRPFDFHRDGPAAAIRLLTPGPDIVCHRDHAGFDLNRIDQILREGRLRPRGFSLTVGLNRTSVLAAGDLKVPIARFRKRGHLWWRLRRRSEPRQRSGKRRRQSASVLVITVENSRPDRLFRWHSNVKFGSLISAQQCKEAHLRACRPRLDNRLGTIDAASSCEPPRSFAVLSAIVD